MLNIIPIFHNLQTNNSISSNDLLNLILNSKNNPNNEDYNTILSLLNNKTKVLEENEYKLAKAYNKILNIKSNKNLRR